MVSDANFTFTKSASKISDDTQTQTQSIRVQVDSADLSLPAIPNKVQWDSNKAQIEVDAA